MHLFVMLDKKCKYLKWAFKIRSLVDNGATWLTQQQEKIHIFYIYPEKKFFLDHFIYIYIYIYIYNVTV